MENLLGPFDPLVVDLLAFLVIIAAAYYLWALFDIHKKGGRNG